MMLGGVGDAILLVALGLGYIVCYLANREEKTLRTAGYLIGIFIILLSASMLLINTYFSARFCRKLGVIKGAKGMMMHRGMMKGQPSQVPTQK